MDPCTNHPDHAAIEHCEVCGDPLCGECLWYGDDGRRLCERHAAEHQAAGGSVQSPELYEEAIRVSGVVPGGPAPPYQGNDTDLTAAAAALLGLASLAMWFGGSYCLPVFAVLLGLAGLTSASRSLNPQRTRTLGAIGFGVGVLSVLPIVFFICFFFFFVVLSFATGQVGP